MPSTCSGLTEGSLSALYYRGQSPAISGAFDSKEEKLQRCNWLSI